MLISLKENLHLCPTLQTDGPQTLWKTFRMLEDIPHLQVSRKSKLNVVRIKIFKSSYTKIGLANPDSTLRLVNVVTFILTFTAACLLLQATNLVLVLLGVYQ